MCASLAISLLAAFIAMLGKQCLNRYSRHAGGSMVERCGDRQRKCDGLEKWPLHRFIDGLSVMLQLSLLLLACGLCQHMWSINITVARTLATIIALVVLFYLAITAAGALSYACPFRRPISIALQSPWEWFRRRFFCITARYGTVLSRAYQVLDRRTWQSPRHQSLSTTSLESVQVHQQRENANDVRCTSWILRNITDPEALDAAIRFAATVRWFEDGIDIEPPYGLIVSNLEACFDSTARLYPGLAVRAYHSAQAALWIHIRAMCISDKLSRKFPLPIIRCDTTSLHHDLADILGVYRGLDTPEVIAWMHKDSLPHTCNGPQTHYYTCLGPAGAYLVHSTRFAVTRMKETGIAFR